MTRSLPDTARDHLSAPSPARAFLFDVDGTLVDSGGAGIRAMRRAFTEVVGVENPWPPPDSGHAPPPADRFDSFSGRTDPYIFRVAVEHYLGRSATPEEERAFFDRYLRYLAEEVPASPRYRVLPGVVGVLQALSARPGCVVGLCTGNLEKGARLKLARGDLNRFFAFGGFGSDDADRGALTRVAIERARLAAGGAVNPLVVGDSPHEVTAARRNGAPVALVATGWTPRQVLQALEPDLFFESFADEEASVARLLGLGDSLRAGVTEVARAVDVVRRGGVLLHPTSTLYGFGGNALDPAVVARVRRLKGGRETPFLVLVPDAEVAWSLASQVPRAAQQLASRFWPGPLTVVLPASDQVPPHLVGPDGTVAVRVEAHPFARALAAATGVPILSSSANRSGEPPPSAPDEVSRDLLLACDLFIEDPRVLEGRPSSVVRVRDDRVEVLREGAIPRGDIEG